MLSKQIYILSLLLFTNSAIHAQTKDSIAMNKQIDEVVVTAQFKPTSLKQSVYNVRVINREEIIRRGTADMQTILQNQLGIRFSNDLVLGESDIQLMGMSGQNVKILLDGIPIIDRGSTKQSLSQIDVNNIERIEIVEGPVSVLYGTDALAGAINIISIDPTKSKKKWNVGLRMIEETVNTEYRPGDKEGKHNVHANLQFQDRDWYINWTGSRNTFGGYQGKETGRALTWQPKEQWLTSGKLGYHKDHLHIFYQLQYLNEDIFTPGEILPSYRYTDKNYFTDRFTQVLQGKWSLTDRFHLLGSLTQQNYKRSTVTKIHNLETGTVELSTQAGEQDISKFSQTFARLTANYQLHSTIDILAGLDFDFDRGSGARIQNNAELYDVAAYISADYKPFKWLLVRPGLRFIHNSIYDSPPVIPSINSKFIINSDFDLRLSYARGFRAPNLRDLYFNFFDTNHQIEGNTNLKAENNNSFIANLNYQKSLTKDFLLKSSINGFYNRFNNLIILSLKPGDNRINTYQNLDFYKTTGGSLENQLHYKNSRLDLGLALVGRFNRLKEQYPDLKEFLWTPELNASFSQDIPTWRSNISIFYKYNGKRPGFETVQETDNQISARQTSISAFHQLDLSLNKDLFRGLSVQAGVRNLTNTTDINNTANTGSGAHTSNVSSVPIAYGRSYFFGLLYNLNK
ncbi:hypothetical protein GCM10022216_22160 [Sphingobacterium kyonggiense]|uniref:Outer membrane receptor for ferrienterochelin and colicins n=2 Tax=Sphingobacterium kyonggiense TaxID=714075 RepID=A0ABP7YV10_9SPHI